MFLWYPHRTHQPRLSGSLTLTGTPKKGMTCQENIPTSSRNSFPVCSSTRNTQCLCTSRHKTPAAIPRPLGPGALGCRILGSLEGSLKAPLQVGLQAFTHVILGSFVLPAWVPLALLLLLNHIELSNFTPGATEVLIKSEHWCCWLGYVSRGEGDCIHPPFPELRDCWELDLKEEVTESWRLEQLVLFASQVKC